MATKSREIGGGRSIRRRAVMVAGLSAFLLLGGGGGILYRLTMPGLLFLQRLSDASPEAEAAGLPLSEREARIAAADGRTIPVRIYEPQDGYDRVVVLLHGVHWGGYQEARLVPFARKLAGLGYAVVTPDIEDLRNYEIAPRAVDDIERALLWTLDESGLVAAGGDGRVGLMGISFSGGLGLSAASRESVRDRVAFALSFGGHGDLDRTAEYLVSSRLPDGEVFPAHVYGQVVLARQLAAQLVPAGDVAAFRELTFLYLKGEEEEVATRLEGLSSESKRLLSLALDRDTETLGGILAPLVRAGRSDPSLSPVRQPPPPCPIFLLHGTVDNVIPPSESRRLATWAETRTETHVLISDLVVHVELEGNETTWKEYWDLSTFITEMLRS